MTNQHPLNCSFYRIACALLLVIFGCGVIHSDEKTERPRIGVLNLKKDDYFASIRNAGGEPVAIFTMPASAIPQKISELDGLILPGGSDIPPSAYGEKPHPTVKAMPRVKYDFNVAFTNRWLKETRKPLFGICLGLQTLNVMAGGDLIQDIPTEIGTDHRKEHPVTFSPDDSRIYSILGKRTLSVNSRHHQAIDTLGRNLKATAKSPDGVIEAVEIPGDRFVVAVQWHPEKMPSDKDQKKLLRAFILECEKHRSEPRQKRSFIPIQKRSPARTSQKPEPAVVTE